MPKAMIYETNNGKDFSDFFKYGHWVPLNDFMIEVYGLYVAAVYGVVFKLHCMDEGVCRASVATIANELGISHSTAKRALAELEQDGLIKRVRGGNRSPVHYKPVPLNDKSLIRFA